jgi:hypothetical protein
MTKQEARETIQANFRKSIDRNVTSLVKEQLQDEGNSSALAICDNVHEEIETWLWSEFSFDWTKVYPNPGGTMGRASAYVYAKAALTYERAINNEEKEKIRELEDEVLSNLKVLWLEWAGYTATSSEKLECAIDEA